MEMGDFSVSHDELLAMIEGANPPPLRDVRKFPAYGASNIRLPDAQWRDHLDVANWADEFQPGGVVVVYCVHGHEVSQGAAAALHELGIDARFLAGGIEGWCEAGLPVEDKS